MTKLRDVIFHFGGIIGNHPFLINNFLKVANPMDKNKVAGNNSTEEDYMATAFLSGLNRGRYDALLNNLHKAFWMGHDK